MSHPSRLVLPGAPALWRLAVLALLPLLFACETPIGVEHVGSRRVYEDMAENALSGASPSIASLHVLNREFLRERYDKDPVGALQALHQRYCDTGDGTGCSCSSPTGPA